MAAAMPPGMQHVTCRRAICCVDSACQLDMEIHLVAVRGDNLLNDQVVGGLIVHCQDKSGTVRLHVGGLAVCQTAAILHAAGCACAQKGYKVTTPKQQEL